MSTMCYGHTNHYFMLLNRRGVLRLRKVILPNTDASGSPGGLTFRTSRIQPLRPPLWCTPPSLLPELSQLLPPRPQSIPTTTGRLILLELKSDHNTPLLKTPQWLLPALWVKATVLVLATWAYTIWSPVPSRCSPLAPSPLSTLFQPHWPPCSSSNMPDTHLPQSLHTGESTDLIAPSPHIHIAALSPSASFHSKITFLVSLPRSPNILCSIFLDST